MTFTDAAAEVLRLVGRPLHYKEITDIAIERNLLSHVGKSPEVTMGARLAATLKKDTPDNPLVRVKPGVFALREWDDKTIKSGLDKQKKRAGKPDSAKARGKDKEVVADEVFDAGDDVSDEVAVIDDDEELIATEEELEEALAEQYGEETTEETAEEVVEDEEPAPSSEPAAEAVAEPPLAAHSQPRLVQPFEEEDEEAEPPGPDETMRAEAAAAATELFDEEDDDDQPILGGDERPTSALNDQGEGRRRRRRRRRGRGGPDTGGPSGGLPSYTATPAFESRRDNGRDREAYRGERDGYTTEAVYRPQVIELTGGESHALDDIVGRDLADAVAGILSSFDRNAGAVSLRQIAETAQRRGRLVGDIQLVQSQVAAAVRADNARRMTAGQRPRFRFAGGRLALTDWLLSPDLARYEQEALAAVDRYRDVARRAFVRKLGELPGHAFVEICVLVLEKLGVAQLRAIRRAGAPGSESHFSGALRTAGEEVKIALVIRRDGREIGRERVTELRGSLHHYGPATAGWIMTTGQTLSGAREEASIPSAAPISLFDGFAIARVCEENDVAVIRARLPIAIPDVDLLEALRNS